MDLCFTDIMGGRVPCGAAGGLDSWPLEPESFLGLSDLWCVVGGGRGYFGAWMQCECCNVRRRHLGGWRGGPNIRVEWARSHVHAGVLYVHISDRRATELFHGTRKSFEVRVLEVIETASDGQRRQTFYAALYIYTLCSLLLRFLAFE